MKFFWWWCYWVCDRWFVVLFWKEWEWVLKERKMMGVKYGKWKRKKGLDSVNIIICWFDQMSKIPSWFFWKNKEYAVWNIYSRVFLGSSPLPKSNTPKMISWLSFDYLSTSISFLLLLLTLLLSFSYYITVKKMTFLFVNLINFEILNVSHNLQHVNFEWMSHNLQNVLFLRTKEWILKILFRTAVVYNLFYRIEYY